MPAAAEIRTLLADQAAAWNRGDLPGFMAAYWNDPALTFYAGDAPTKGWRETRDRYFKRYQAEGKEMGRLTFDLHAVETLGPEHAWVRGGWQLKLKAGPAGGLFTLVLRKLPVGWRIVHDHTSAKPA